MAKSAQDAGLTVDGTVKSMMELQMKGGLISEKVLPHFARNMSAAARANGGLDKAMLSNRVAMNRLMFSFQEAGNIIFKSGFGEGLTKLFNAMAESVVKLKPLWEALGKIIGSVFSLIADGVKWVTPMFVSMGEVLNSITRGLGESYAFLVAMAGPALYIYKLFGSKALKALPIVGQFVILLDLIKEVAFWAEELDNLLFSKNKIGLLYDPRKGAANNTGANVAQHMLGAANTSNMSVGDSMMMSLMNMFSKGNIGGFVASGMGSAINAGQFMGNKLSITGTVNIDGQKVGEIVAQNPSIKDAIQSEIKMVQN